MKKILIILLAIFILSGCSPKIKEGEVMTKEHNEAWTQLMILPMIMSNGKTSTTILVPYYIFHPENWRIVIENYDDKGKRITEDFYINQQVYSDIEVGDMFRFDESVGTDKENTYKIEEDKITEEDLKGYEVKE